MTESSPRRAVHVRWDQILVLALVIVAADVAGTWWITRESADAPSVAEPSSGASSDPPDASILDEDMSRTIRRVALENGLNPTILPELPELWQQMSESRASAAGVDPTDRDAVRGVLETYVAILASNERSGGPGAVGGGSSEGGFGRMPGGEADEQEGDAPVVAPSIERLVEMQSLRLEKLAESNGVDPEQVMPSEELRQAAISSGDPKSAEAEAVMEAFRQAIRALEGGRPPRDAGAP